MPQVSTIFALSSAPGRAAVAVIRVSGPAAAEVLRRMIGVVPKPRQAVLRTVRHPQTGAALDQALVLFFQAPHTETGEDVAELQVHGGRAVMHAVLAALATIEGCRMAEPGEFARRAFANGKLDLAQAEGLADLIDAETEAQRKQAIGQVMGAQSKLYEGWRLLLIEAAALVEAAIDFSDEGDVAADAVAQARSRVTALTASLRAHLDDGHRGEIVREGFRVVLAGLPNAGKSSLLNALARRDVAIVSPEPGTTRDAIAVRLDLGGLPVVVTDTAGLREAAGGIEREGIRRALAHAQDADLVLWVTDATEAEPPLPRDLEGLGERVLPVRNKVDLMPLPAQSVGVAVSAVSGTGLAELTRLIGKAAEQRVGAERTEPVIAQVRHRHQIEACIADLDAVLAGPDNHLELRAEELRRAAGALGRITGRVDPESVLDQVFQRFCIGK